MIKYKKTMKYIYFYGLTDVNFMKMTMRVRKKCNKFIKIHHIHHIHHIK